MSTRTVYIKTALVGGANTAVDGIDGDDLLDGDVCHAFVSDVLYAYLLDDDSGAVESSPDILAPDSNPGDKRWILQNAYGLAAKAASGANADITSMTGLDDGGIPYAAVYGAGNLYFPDYTETDQGLTGSGASVKAYVDTIGSDSATMVFRHNSGSATTTYTFSTDETIPANIHVTAELGVRISVASGKTLTINGTFSGPLAQVFTGDGTVTFGGQSVTQLEALWWGSDGAAIQKAISSMTSSGCPILHISKGVWDVSTTITETIAAAERFQVRGDGMGNTILSWSGANNGIIMDLTATAGSGDITFDGVEFDGEDKASTLLELENFQSNVLIRRCIFIDTLTHATMPALNIINESHNGRIEGCWFYDLASTAISLNLAGAAAGPVEWNIVNNRLQASNNYIIKGKNVNSLQFRGNCFEAGPQGTYTNAKGLYIDQCTNLTIDGNYFETIEGTNIYLNSTTASTLDMLSARILGNIFNNCNADNVVCGNTEGVRIEGNSFVSIRGGNDAINVTAGAERTIIGRNFYETAGTWETNYVTDNGTDTIFTEKEIVAVNFTSAVTAGSSDDYNSQIIYTSNYACPKNAGASKTMVFDLSSLPIMFSGRRVYLQSCVINYYTEASEDYFTAASILELDGDGTSTNIVQYNTDIGNGTSGVGSVDIIATPIRCSNKSKVLTLLTGNATDSAADLRVYSIIFTLHGM